MTKDWETTRRRFLAATFTGGLLNAASDAKVPSPDNTTLAEFDVHSDGDMLIVPVTIAEKQYRFVIDTGAQYTVFDDSLAPLLGPPLESEFVVNGDAPAKAHLWPKMRLGGIELSMLPSSFVVRMNLQSMREASGDDINGFLGFDWLKWQILQVDFRDGKLRFLRQAPMRSGSEVPLEIADNQVHLRVVLPEIGEVRLQVDTGSDGSIDLQPRAFERLKKSKVLTRVVSKALGTATITGTMRTERGFLDFVELGGNRHPNVEADSQAQRTSDDAGKLGLRLLSKYSVTFDFPNKRMLLNDAQCLNEGGSSNRSGLAFVRRDGRCIVVMIEPGSPGQRAGVAVGDEIVDIDGKDVSKSRLFTLRRSFSRIGSSVNVQVRRQGRLKDYTLLIRD